MLSLQGDRYKVISALAEGGFGQIYIAEDTHRPGNPKCIVKHLKPASQDLSFLQVARRLFNSEAKTLEKLGRHEQIPQLLAYFEENQEFYLVQEYIEGYSLSEELATSKKLSQAQVITLLQDVLGILEFVHQQNVIHRDIKPSNLIRRQSDGKLVLIDFGAVKEIHTQLAINSGQTDLTVVVGTQGYMPNEQCAGKPRFNSDIYALGVVAIQALTGLKSSQLGEDAKTFEIIWRYQAQVSPILAEIIDKMVRYDFRQRYQSATEVLQALEKLTDTAVFKQRHNWKRLIGNSWKMLTLAFFPQPQPKFQDTSSLLTTSNNAQKDQTLPPVSYVSGSTISTLQGDIAVNEVRRYSLNCNQGQQLTMEVIVGNVNVTFADPDGKTVATNLHQAKKWQGLLSKGIYTLEIAALEQSTYTITVDVLS